MSPILKRLAGLLGRSAVPAAKPPTESEPERKRRRRGGRGRGGSTGANGASAAPAPSAERPAERAPSTPRARTPEPPRRNSNAGSYDRRRASRRSLDQPLPEDIAFRPPAEGGDRSILPSRRRPPPGLKATKRVLVAGSRFVPRGPDAEVDEDEHETQPPTGRTLPANGAPSTEALSESGDSEGARKPRRRGRRGGRGRRRGGADTTPASDT